MLNIWTILKISATIGASFVCKWEWALYVVPVINTILILETDGRVKEQIKKK